MSTPHIESSKDEIAKIVLMPGDPLRAKYIAKKYLKKAKLVNEIRGMYAYTGFYKDTRITVMASGMGNPSMGIYSYELFKEYEVDTIIRLGSCGAYLENLNLGDVILVNKSISSSSYAYLQNGYPDNSIFPSAKLNTNILNQAGKDNIKVITGAIYSSDTFYEEEDKSKKRVEKYEVLGVEMESFALFHNAKLFGKEAACLLTVSDSVYKDEVLSPKEREQNLDTMIKLALDSVVNNKEVIYEEE